MVPLHNIVSISHIQTIASPPPVAKYFPRGSKHIEEQRDVCA